MEIPEREQSLRPTAVKLEAFYLVGGVCVALGVVWLAHRMASRGPTASGVKQLADRIWWLERWFFGFVLSIILIADIKEITLLLRGKADGESLFAHVAVLLIGLIGSVMCLLVARLVDETSGGD